MNIHHQNTKYICALNVTIQIKTTTISGYPWKIMDEYNKSFRKVVFSQNKTKQLQQTLKF